MKDNKPKKQNNEIDWVEVESSFDNITQEQLDFEAEKHEKEMEVLREIMTAEE